MCELCEKFSKSLLKRNRGVPFQISLPSDLKKNILKEYQKAKKEYFNSLYQNLNQLQAGSITKDQYGEFQRDAIKNAFTKAFSLGKYFGNGRDSSLDETERRFIGYQTFKEMSFMEKFADDVVNNGGRMKYNRRMKMYVDGLDSMFGFGRLVYLPDDIQIYWKLGVTDKHCIDCLMFAANNPYTKKTLPGFPKSGASQCLSNCRCSLEYFYANGNTTNKYDSFVANLPLNSKEIPSEQDFETAMNLVDEYYYNRFMYEITKDKNFQRGYSNKLKEFNNFVRTNNLNLPFNFDIANSIKDVKMMNGLNAFRRVVSPMDVQSGDFIGVFVGRDLTYAKVQSVSGTDILVKTIEQLPIYLNVSRHVIFKEIL